VRANGGYSLGNWFSSQKYLETLNLNTETKEQYAGQRFYAVSFQNGLKPGGKAIPESLIQWVEESSFNKMKEKIVGEYENVGKQFSANEVIPEKIMQQALQALGIQSETLTSTLSDDI